MGRPNDEETVRLTFAVATIIYNRPKITLTEIAQTFDIPEKEAEKIVGYVRNAEFGEAQFDQSVQIHVDEDTQGFEYDNRVADRGLASALNLSPSQVSKLLAALFVTANTLEGQSREHCISAAHKILASLPQKQDLPLVTRSFAQPEDQPRSDIVVVIEQALLSECRVKITYENLEGEVTQRVIEPLTIDTSVEPGLLRAFCLLRNDLREFNLDQILDAQMLPDQHYDPNKVAEKDTQRSITFDLRREGRYFLERLPGAQKELDEDGNAHVTLDYYGGTWFLHELLALGRFVSNLKPTEITVKAAAEAKKALSLY